ncbi:hypothetical protein [Paraburkholderia tagetis]|uniref:hypothetical protein n=1 Tax=Paraburkholderia tagetis TaxID=2913261 RepID=UPI00308404EE
MATLARRVFKIALFIGLFLLSVRCIGRNGPMPERDALRWLSIANGLGLREADDVYVPVMLAIDLLVAVLAYVAIMKLWRCWVFRVSLCSCRSASVAPVRGGTYFSLQPQRKVGKRKRLKPPV